MYQNVFLATLFFASQVIAIVPRSPFAHILVPRQSTCDSACATFSNALDACTTKGCLCIPSVASGLQNCVDCATSGSPTSDVVATAQQLVDTFQSTCSGFGLAPVTVKVPKTTPVVTPVTPITTPVAPITTPVVVTPPPVTVTRTTPAVVSTPPAPGTTVVDATTLSQTVVRPVTTISTNPNGGVGTSIPGLTSAALREHQVTYGGALVFGVVLGVTLLAF